MFCILSIDRLLSFAYLLRHLSPSVIQNRNRYQRRFLLNTESTTVDGSNQPANSFSFNFLTVAPLPMVRSLLLDTRKARVGGGDERKKIVIVNTRWRPMEEIAVYPAGS